MEERIFQPDWEYGFINGYGEELTDLKPIEENTEEYNEGYRWAARRREQRDTFTDRDTFTAEGFFDVNDMSEENKCNIRNKPLSAAELSREILTSFVPDTSRSTNPSFKSIAVEAGQSSDYIRIVLSRYDVVELLTILNNTAGFNHSALSKPLNTWLRTGNVG